MCRQLLGVHSAIDSRICVICKSPYYLHQCPATLHCKQINTCLAVSAFISIHTSAVIFINTIIACSTIFAQGSSTIIHV